MENVEYIIGQLKRIWDNTSSPFYKSLHNCELGKRGYWFPVNPSPVEVLITGINPSFREEESLTQNPIPIKDIIDNPGYDTYWTPAKRIIFEDRKDRPGYGIDYRDKSAFMDLFYFREKNQKCIGGTILCWPNKSGVPFLTDQLRVSQERIELLKPKVIVVKNRESQAYWGKLNSPKRECIWMGYEFTSIPFNGHPRWDVARITGINSKNISGLSSSELVRQGTVVLFAQHINQYTSVEERPTPETIERLLKLV